MNAQAESLGDHGLAMDRMYRWQRHVYDLTRRYYLLGRDELLDRLAPPPGGSVLEIGCGTGRNLIGAARRYPEARLHGIDISQEMLNTARDNLSRQNLLARVRLAKADASSFVAKSSLGRAQFDRVFFSFTISMIPDWQAALLRATALLAPGGELHVVDFGQCERMPPAVRRMLFRWLAAFHVSPRESLYTELRGHGEPSGASIDFLPRFKGYAWLASLRLRSEAKPANRSKRFRVSAHRSAGG
jgi:S-adenosylmethionine-diacylgycerolhomoserine-N-methlytransferase